MAAVVLVAMMLFLSSCRPPASSQASEFAGIERLVQSGLLPQAEDRVARARKQCTDPRWATKLRVEDATIALYRGDNPRAVALLAKDLPPDTDADVAAERLLVLALASARTQNPARSRAALEEAEVLVNRPGPGSRKRGEFWSMEAILALGDGRLEDAERLFHRSHEEARSRGDRFLEARTALGISTVSLQESHYENALEEARAASKAAASIDAGQTMEKALGNAGWAYYEMGDLPRALASFESATASAASLGTTIDEEHWLHTAGMSEARLGDLKTAREDYDRSLALARSLNNAAEITYVDQAMASLLLHGTRPQDATPYIEEARELARRTRDFSDLEFGDLLEGQLLAKEASHAQAKRLLLDVERKTASLPTTRLEAQHTLAQVCEKLADGKEAGTWYERSIATYHAERSALDSDDARLPFFENGRELYMDYVSFLIREHRNDAALDVIDEGRAAALSEGLGLESKTTAARPQLHLNALARQAHAVVLVYALAQDASYLWAANGRESGFYTLPTRHTIAAEVTDQRRDLLAARDPLAESDPAARRLYDVLVKPAERLIQPGDRVYLVAGDGLNGLNFETLLTPGPSSHYWIDDVAITNIASARLLGARRSQQPDGPARALIVGNPVYAGQPYAALPHAAEEVHDVALHFPADARTVLTGSDASPERYLESNPSRFAYIHFVSHAVASELVPLDSAVILTADGTADSAKLYARAVLSHPLRARLVTLSSCQGAGARAYAGEGLVGLAWAFLRAGSHEVIGALWDVSDAATPELMQHLYDGLAQAQPPDAALRSAKLAMLHTHGVFRKPLYWGAFQLYSSGR